MNKSINLKFKKNIIVLSIIITVVFLIINVALYIINNNYLVNKVSEENNAFLQLTTHLINENDVSIALEYAEHYTHIHQVNIEVLDDQENMLYSSNVAHLYTSQYQINTLKGTFTIFIDNTNSVTVKAIERNTIYINGSLLIIYLVSIFSLIRINNRTTQEIDEDLKNVLKLINNEKLNANRFYYSEFEQIYRVVTRYLESIDLLTEQKSMNMKGLAHDIKTPLTLVYSYFEKALKSKELSEKDAKTAFDAAIRINELLNDIMEDNKRMTSKKINISRILNEKIVEYSSIFENKKISITANIEGNINIKWSEKDFVRVIDNLISNAYYYSKESSVFEVDVIKNERIQMEFVSTPKNVNDIEIDKLFNKEFRGTLSTNDNQYGKGYGLYLCRLLLGSIGGSIRVDLLNENVKFTIIL